MRRVTRPPACLSLPNYAELWSLLGVCQFAGLERRKLHV